jgi:hypothetical protein
MKNDKADNEDNKAEDIMKILNLHRDPEEEERKFKEAGAKTWPEWVAFMRPDNPNR